MPSDKNEAVNYALGSPFQLAQALSLLGWKDEVDRGDKPIRYTSDSRPITPDKTFTTKILTTKLRHPR